LTASVFFIFHAATLDAFWKPMYIFDVLCGMFSLLCLLSWACQRWILSFVCFWMAYKAKEVAVMLPAALLVWEYTVGERRWKQLVPFWLVSLSFGVQAIVASRATNDAYTLRLTPAAVWQSITFYSSALLLLPYAGLVLIALPAIVRDRRVLFGVAAFCLLLIPMLVLPGRLFAVYLYVPIIGLALALAALAERRALFCLAVLLVFWLPLNYVLSRRDRRAHLEAARDNQAYVGALASFTRAHTSPPVFVVDGAPERMRQWGIEGTLGYFYRHKNFKVILLDSPQGRAALEAGHAALLRWDPVTHTLTAHLK
jgi:hypothetical protein